MGQSLFWRASELYLIDLQLPQTREPGGLHITQSVCTLRSAMLVKTRCVWMRATGGGRGSKVGEVRWVEESGGFEVSAKAAS